ncbi:endolytic transglycosylase MltG [Sphingobium sufflavum]|uniref:endolytic transglycosylase MltG n=1 Tax=Sphingobium sufflavum TaxID=1129547 RepID=UPI001F1DF562|nr:endolytic transglycosylase MltG [Sphingobium sufflavum]MCE7798254.1 endolytic transglycosylase MltG [Sphingobium sufflavum]
MRRTGLLIVAILGAALVFIGFNFVYGWVGDGPLTQDKTIVVPTGATLTSAARVLKAQGAVKSADAFLTRAKLFGGSAPIKAGEYVIPRGASNRQILSILQGGKALTHLVTVAEGLPSIIVHEKLMAEDELTGTIPVPAEGSILPDSYAFEKGESRAAVLARMQGAMTDYLAAAWKKRSPDTPVKTPQEAVTLASIVEKETGVGAERTIVAGVYANRLRIGMMLQADPTIIYPITKGKPLGRRIRKSEIAAVNGYNTYAMPGLPRGPIANPGRASIDAVLAPAATKALYFVADGKGGHIFADTLDEQNENVRKWFEIRRQRGEL